MRKTVVLDMGFSCIDDLMLQFTDAICWVPG